MSTAVPARRERNLSDRVARQLALRIIDGELAAQALLPREETLLQELDVSRTVLREAVKILAAKGLLESRQKRGTTVRPPSDWNVLDRDVLSWQAECSRDDRHLLQLMEVRQIVEPAAARLAAQRATADDVQAIGLAAQAMKTHADAAADFVAADFEFHRLVLMAAKNDLLVPVANLILNSLRASLQLTNQDGAGNQQSQRLHERVAVAIAARDAAAAERAMKRLLADAGERIAAALSTPARRRTAGRSRA
jgi:DNA-binding FadR family transcriptional regulator